MQDEHQKARCWFGAGVSQQMQGEHDAALQSMDIAEDLTSEMLLLSKAKPEGREQGSSSDDTFTSDEEAITRQSATKPGSQPTEQLSAARVLAVKVLLAKASILKQLKRTDEANQCMKTARKLDFSVGKYVKE